MKIASVVSAAMLALVATPPLAAQPAPWGTVPAGAPVVTSQFQEVPSPSDLAPQPGPWGPAAPYAAPPAAEPSAAPGYTPVSPGYGLADAPPPVVASSDWSQGFANGVCPGGCGGACGGGAACGGYGRCGGLCGGTCHGAGGLLGRLGNLRGAVDQHLMARRYGGFGSQILGRLHGPLGSGAWCAPRSYDIYAEWLFLQRDDVGPSVPLASLGVQGPTVLSTDDLDFNEQSGFRLTWSYLVGPSANLELTYMGTFHWADSAEVTSANGNLFSVFSNFGLNPPGGFAETDAALRQSIDYSSDLDSAEINLRRRWMSANCWLHGSYLIGFRYLSLVEDFGYRTRTGLGSLDSVVGTDSDMFGAQFGGDWSVGVTSRLRVGAELKAGLYGVKNSQDTRITGPTITTIHEDVHGGNVGFVSEGQFVAIYRVTPRLALRGGYELLYADGLALATANFNTASPLTTRKAVLNDNGDVFYHGATAGFEWLW